MDTTTSKPKNNRSKSELEKFKLFYEFVAIEKDENTTVTQR